MNGPCMNGPEMGRVLNMYIWGKLRAPGSSERGREGGRES